MSACGCCRRSLSDRDVVAPAAWSSAGCRSNDAPMSLDRDRFDDRGEIGRGGLGVVRRTFDRALRRMVAVKSLLDPGADAEVRARFAREAQICGQLDHPNIIPIYDVACAATSGLV